MSKILASALVFTVLIAAFMITADDGYDPFPEIQTNISGTWELVGDADVVVLGSIMSLEQEGWLFTGELRDGAESTGVDLAGAFINKDGTAFVFDLSTDSQRCLVYGLVSGDNIWLSALGDNGSTFAYRNHFLRQGGTAGEMDPYTVLDDEYTAVAALQINRTETVNLAGENMAVISQSDGIVHGTMEQDVNGTVVDRNFIAVGVYKETDSRGLMTEYHIMMDENDFWIMQSIPSLKQVALKTVAFSESGGEGDRVVTAFRSYISNDAPSGLSGGIQGFQDITGKWQAVHIVHARNGIISVPEKRECALDVEVQSQGMFFGTMYAEDYRGSIGGSLLSPSDNYLFMAGPAVGNAVNLLHGWQNGNTIYMFSIFEDNGVKVASAEMYHK